MSKVEIDESIVLGKGFVWMVSDRAFHYSGEGYHLRFKPGVPKPVAPLCQGPVMAMGAKAVNGQAQPTQNIAPTPKVDSTKADARAQIRTAAEAILARNNSADFGANGLPYVKAWQDELGFRPDERVRSEVWEEMKQDLVVGADA